MSSHLLSPVSRLHVWEPRLAWALAQAQAPRSLLALALASSLVLALASSQVLELASAPSSAVPHM
jgi:hypothetical protein